MHALTYHGIVAPVVSPCDEQDGLDLEALHANTQRLLRKDIAGLYICGGTGDAAALTQAERQQVAAQVVPQVKAAGKTAIVHVGQTTARQAVQLAEHAFSAGADAVASIPPRKGWPQVAEWYRMLCNVGGDVFIYDIPGMTGITPSYNDLARLMELPHVAGVKISDWNIFLIRQLKAAFPEKTVFSGFDELLLPGLLYGADGCIGTWQNLLPQMYVQVYQLVQSGNLAKAQAISTAFTAFLAEGWPYGVLDTFEELMLAKGYARRCFRRPSSWNPGKVPEDVLRRLLAQVDALNCEQGA